MSISLNAIDFDTKTENISFSYDYSNLVISFADCSSGYIRFSVKNNNSYPNLILDCFSEGDTRETLYNATNLFIIKKMHDNVNIENSYGNDLECVIEHTSNDYFSKRMFLCFILSKSTELWGDDVNKIFDSLSVASLSVVNSKNIQGFKKDNANVTANIQLNSALTKNQSSDKQGFYYKDAWLNHIIVLKKSVAVSSVTYGSIQEMLNSGFVYTATTDVIKTDLNPQYNHKIYNISIPVSNDPKPVADANPSSPPISSNTYPYFLQPVREKFSISRKENFVEGVENQEQSYMSCYPVTENNADPDIPTLFTSDINQTIHAREYTLQIVVVFFSFIFMTLINVFLAPPLYLFIMNNFFSNTKNNFNGWNVRIVEFIILVVLVTIFVTLIAVAYSPDLEISYSTSSTLSITGIILAAMTAFTTASIQFNKSYPSKNDNWDVLDFDQISKHKYSESFPYYKLVSSENKKFGKNGPPIDDRQMPP